MIIELNANDFDGLLSGSAPQGMRLVPDSAIAPPEVLGMLADLAAEIATAFSPAAWAIVENGEVVGLCSVIRPPENGDVHLGYGIAPSRHGRGYATRAIGELLEWARKDPRVVRLSAETGEDNIASQLVLLRNGFVESGRRVDPEDGPLICWAAATP